MTPEEKARELSNKMYPFCKDRKISKLSGSMGHSIQLENAKNASIVCVDEIIEELEPDDLFKNYNERVTYWRDVKAEIEKL